MTPLNEPELDLIEHQDELNDRLWAFIQAVGHLDCGGWHWDTFSPDGELICACGAVLMATHSHEERRA